MVMLDNVCIYVLQWSWVHRTTGDKIVSSESENNGFTNWTVSKHILFIAKQYSIDMEF